MNQQPPKTVKRQVKHTFTNQEREALSQNLVQKLGERDEHEAVAKQIKSSYTAKIDECDASIATISTNLRAGFEFREMECRVEFKPKTKKKEFYRVDTGEHVGTEDMTQADFQMELAMEDSRFESRDELPVFSVGSDKAVVVVAKTGSKWTAAIRAQLGTNSLSERLNSAEGKAVKERFHAIKAALGRLTDWIDNVSPGSAEGFAPKIAEILAAQEEKFE